MQDKRKYPKISSTCSKCNEQSKKHNFREFATAIKKNDQQKYTTYCMRCLLSNEQEILETTLSPLQQTKHPVQFNKQIKRQIDYPDDEQPTQDNTKYLFQAGYQLICQQHGELQILWNKKTNQLACIKCAYDGKSINIGDGSDFTFLEQQLASEIKNVEVQIAKLDRAIDHYKEQEEVIEKTKQEQQRRDAECKEEIVNFIENKCKIEMQQYIQKKNDDLDKQDSKIGDYTEEIDTRGRILRDRGDSIMQFVKNFKDKSALYLKMDPMSLFKEDISFWTALNKDWKSENFNWSYKNPSFQFEDPEKVATDIFEIKYVRSKDDLRIVDFKY